MKDNGLTLIYDDECRLCAFAKKMMERWDTQHHIRFLPFQDKASRLLAPDIASMKSLDAMRLIHANATVLSGVDAFRGMLPALPMGQIVAFIFTLPGVAALAEKLYRVIAKNRIAWFGKCLGKCHCMSK